MVNLEMVKGGDIFNPSTNFPTKDHQPFSTTTSATHVQIARVFAAFIVTLTTTPLKSYHLKFWHSFPCRDNQHYLK